MRLEAHVNQKVFSALTGQGFSEKQARAALARVSGNTEARTCEQVLRSTLLWLTRKPGDRSRRAESPESVVSRFRDSSNPATRCRRG